MTKNYRLIIAYDGTNYHGWQIQLTGLSIQELIQKAISTITQKPIKLIGSGRTDAGVHATGQTAHFKIDKVLDDYRFLKSINALLPHDIRVLSLQEVSPDFHARYSATGKTYHYHLFLDKVLNPFRRLYSWHLHVSIDIEQIKAAIPHFLGTHDFTSFANEARSGIASYDSTRTIHQLNWLEEEGGVCLEFKGDGFLYKMVRNIVGTLVEIGYHKISANAIPKLFEQKDRRCTGSAAPPQGLFLVKVDYPDFLILQKTRCATLPVL